MLSNHSFKIALFSTAKNVNDEEKKAFNALKRASKELFAICYSCWPTVVSNQIVLFKPIMNFYNPSNVTAYQIVRKSCEYSSNNILNKCWRDRRSQFFQTQLENLLLFICLCVNCLYFCIRHIVQQCTRWAGQLERRSRVAEVCARWVMMRLLMVVVVVMFMVMMATSKAVE